MTTSSKKPRRRARWIVAGTLVVALAVFARSFMASPLDEPPALDAALPAASPPAEVALLQLPTGVIHRSAGFAYRGGSFLDARDFSMAAALVKHPRGDVIIDTGFGRDVDAHFAAMPIGFRAVTSYTRGHPARDQLDAAGYDVKKLRGILLTHAHWDHVSGVSDFPETPVLVTREERAFIRSDSSLSAVARDFGGDRYEEYAFEGGPYLGFPKSHDLYGDGSIVVVPVPGHTPGSVIVFVASPQGTRWAFVGDLCWQSEGVTEREERPWLQRVFADDDAEGVREGLLRVNAIVTAHPAVSLVPAHDARAFEKLPRL